MVTREWRGVGCAWFTQELVNENMSNVDPVTHGASMYTASVIELANERARNVNHADGCLMFVWSNTWRISRLVSEITHRVAGVEIACVN